MVNRMRKKFAQSIFFGISPMSSNITRCQVPSRVRAWFNDSAGNIDFYQMFRSQSEFTSLHESKIHSNVDQGSIYQHYKFHRPGVPVRRRGHICFIMTIDAFII